MVNLPNLVNPPKSSFLFWGIVNHWSLRRIPAVDHNLLNLVYSVRLAQATLGTCDLLDTSEGKFFTLPFCILCFVFFNLCYLLVEIVCVIICRLFISQMVGF